MKITNRLNLPSALVAAVANDPYQPGECNITVSRLIQPPRKVALEALYSKEITEDVSDRLWALFGQAVHVILERAETEALVEQRLTIQRQEWKISGRFDRFAFTEGILQDYKVCSAYAVKNGTKQEWDCQLNILATILREHGHDIRQLEVVAILRDWSKNYVSRGSDYPDRQVLKIEIPLWSLEKCEEYLDERIRLHQMARTNLPECSPEERWAKPDQWALTKDGRKTAVRVYDQEIEAQVALRMAGPNHAIEHRPGKNLRCESYCPAAPFCDQWKTLNKEASHETETPTTKNPTR